MRALLLVFLASATALADPLDNARAALRGGRYSEVEKLARGGRPRDEAELLAARADLALGRYAEAEKKLSAIVARTPMQVAARVELGRLYRATGRVSDEKMIWNRFFDDYEQGRIDKKSAAQLTAVAVAARYLGSYEDANATFGDAARADEKYEPARVEWG